MPRGTCKCKVHVGQVCECCVFAESTKLDQLAGRGPVRWLRSLRIQAGVPGRQRGVLVFEASVNVHVLVNLEGILCVPALVTFNPDQLKRRKGTFHCPYS